MPAARGDSLTPASDEEVLWVGVDAGDSQVGVAIVDLSGSVLAESRVVEALPEPSPERRGAVEGRLATALEELEGFVSRPVIVAGDAKPFLHQGWNVRDAIMLNDIIGHYGRTSMPGNCIVAACGSYRQVVWVDDDHNIRWPSDDLAHRLPHWLLSGHAYATLLTSELALPAVRKLLELARCDPLTAAEPGHAALWRDLGVVLADNLDDRRVSAFVLEAATAAAETFHVFREEIGADHPPPTFVLSGGAVIHNELWALVQATLRSHSIVAERPNQPSPAVGTALYAMRYRDRDHWSHLGAKPPGWQSWSDADWENYDAGR